MTTIKMSSDEARSKWREVIDTAVAGNHIIIERYGKPVVAIVAHPEYLESLGQANAMREPATVYQTASWDREALKAELITEIKAELFAKPNEWRDAILQVELAQMRQNEITHLEEEIASPEQQSPNIVPKAETSEVVYLRTPRLVQPEQAADFKKEIVAESTHAEL